MHYFFTFFPHKINIFRERTLYNAIKTRHFLSPHKCIGTKYPAYLLHFRIKKAPQKGAFCGLWQIRTVDLFRVKEAL